MELTSPPPAQMTIPQPSSNTNTTTTTSSSHNNNDDDNAAMMINNNNNNDTAAPPYTTNGGSNHANSHDDATPPTAAPTYNFNNFNNNTNKITNLKFLNITSFLLTSMLVIGTVLFGVREEGVFGDEFLWMRYQTLLSPPNYVNYIWYLLFTLQGLFIYASCHHPTLQTSPLVGYYNHDTNGNAAAPLLLQLSKNNSIAIHYPAICATTLMTIYSHDYGYIGCALVSSILCSIVLMNVLRIQGNALNEMEMANNKYEDDDGSSSAKHHVENGSSSSRLEEPMADDYYSTTITTTTTTPIKDIQSRALEYIALRLPFELYGGYSLALVALYLTMFLDGYNDVLPTVVFLIVANISLVGLLGVGYWMLWKIPDRRKFYGVGVALVWYLLGVAMELHEPTQPIYNEFSDAAILTTQIVAGLATTLLMTMLCVRLTKTMIKYNLFNCVAALAGGDTSVVSEEDEITTDYVHA